MLFLFVDLRTMILEKETELAKVNKELKDLEHYKVMVTCLIWCSGLTELWCKHDRAPYSQNL